MQPTRKILVSSWLTLRVALRIVFIAATITGLGTVNAAESVSATPFEEQPPTMEGLLTFKKNLGDEVWDRLLEQYATTHAFVYFDGAGAPIGRIVLMRREGALCAVRFTKFHRGEDTPEGWFTPGGPSLYAEYDWYTLRLPTNTTRPTLIKFGHRKLSLKPPHGISMLLSTSTGNQFVKCGSIEPRWMYPNVVMLIKGSGAVDHEIELAPTSWQDIAEIDLANPSLRWYRNDGKRRATLIPLEQLMKNSNAE